MLKDSGEAQGKTKVDVSINLENILDINEVANEVTFKFETVLEWRDERLDFLYLKDSEDVNIVETSLHDIWVRRIYNLKRSISIVHIGTRNLVYKHKRISLGGNAQDNSEERRRQDIERPERA